MNKLYYTALDIAEMLGISRTKAYKLVRQLNQELEQRGYITISGKIPKKYFEQRCYGLAD